jgi:hypothetical protein
MSLLASTLQAIGPVAEKIEERRLGQERELVTNIMNMAKLDPDAAVGAWNKHLGQKYGTVSKQREDDEYTWIQHDPDKALYRIHKRTGQMALEKAAQPTQKGLKTTDIGAAYKRISAIEKTISDLRAGGIDPSNPLTMMALSMIRRQDYSGAIAALESEKNFLATQYGIQAAPAKTPPEDTPPDGITDEEIEELINLGGKARRPQ